MLCIFCHFKEQKQRNTNENVDAPTIKTNVIVEISFGEKTLLKDRESSLLISRASAFAAELSSMAWVDVLQSEYV